MYCKLLTKRVLYELNPELGLGNRYKLILFKCKQVTLYERSCKTVTYRDGTLFSVYTLADIDSV